MCFSPEMDLVAGFVIGAIGVDALFHRQGRAELPLAVLPSVLGVHQVIEAFVWFGLRRDVGEGAYRAALWGYLLIAFGVLPVLVPLAVGALEPAVRRRRVAALSVVGAAVATLLLVGLFRGPVVAAVEGHHLAYRVGLWHGRLLVAGYVVATCGSLLWSSRRAVRWFGAVNLLMAGLLAWLASSAFISLWCLWAAVTSAAIAVHLRARRPTPDATRATADR